MAVEGRTAILASTAAEDTETPTEVSARTALRPGGRTPVLRARRGCGSSRR